MSDFSLRFKGLISEEQNELLDWLELTTRNLTTSRVLWGYCTAIGVEHQDWTFWQILNEAKRTFVVKLVS